MAKDKVQELMHENDLLEKTIQRSENSNYAGMPGMSARIKELRVRIQDNKETIKTILAKPAGTTEEDRLRKAVLGDQPNEEFMGTTSKRGN